jgi:hypothetical protein
MPDINRKPSDLTAQQVLAVNEHAPRKNCDRGHCLSLLVKSKPHPCLARRIIDVAPIEMEFLAGAKVPPQEFQHFFAVFI